MNPRVARPVLRASTMQVPPTSIRGPRAAILPFEGRSPAPSRPRRVAGPITSAGPRPIVLRLVGIVDPPGPAVA